MKILHLCLANFYIDGYAYQENVLPRINMEDGHDVMIIASTETFIDNKILGYVPPKRYKTEYGVIIERIPYKRIINNFITHKIRIYRGLYERIRGFAPDVIMCHNLSFGSIKDVIRYKKENPDVRLFADTHTASFNSGLNWLSLNILHRIYYRHLIKLALPYLEKYFYIGEAERLFSIKNYGVPEDIMEFFPLGGLLLEQDEYTRIREKRRLELKVNKGERLYVHSGKLDAQKRTKELIEAYSAVEDDGSKLVIIGSITADLQKSLQGLIDSDRRILFLGWKSSEELQEYLCACDLYCQPGSPSAIMQNAICNKCAIMAYPHLPYTTNFDWNNFFWVKTIQDMKDVFFAISKEPQVLIPLKENSWRCARELLDYRKLATRIYK